MKSPIETFLKESGEMIAETFVKLPEIRSNEFKCDLATNNVTPAR